jgi:hypothetical protein
VVAKEENDFYAYLWQLALNIAYRDRILEVSALHKDAERVRIWVTPCYRRDRGQAWDLCC